MLKLHTKKIRAEMARMELTEYDLAETWGLTRQAVYDFLNRRPITQADRFAKALNLDAKDLIIDE